MEGPDLSDPVKGSEMFDPVKGSDLFDPVKISDLFDLPVKPLVGPFEQEKKNNGGFVFRCCCPMSVTITGDHRKIGTYLVRYTQKTIYFPIFFLTTFGPVNYGPP